MERVVRHLVGERTSALELHGEGGGAEKREESDELRDLSPGESVTPYPRRTLEGAIPPNFRPMLFVSATRPSKKDHSCPSSSKSFRRRLPISSTLSFVESLLCRRRRRCKAAARVALRCSSEAVCSEINAVKGQP